MEPVTLILTVLASGAPLGVEDTVSMAVKGAYEGPKALVNKRLGGRRDGELLLARYEEAPGTWEGLPAAELTATKADADLVVAQSVMRLADGTGPRACKYAVSASDGQSVLAGDHNTQYDTPGTSPDR